MDLSDELTPALLHTTCEYVSTLNGMGIATVRDFVSYLPRDYEDLSQMHTIATSGEGEKVTIRGTVMDIKLIRTRKGKYLAQANFMDTDGSACKVVWFNQPHIKRMLSEDQDVVLTGRLVTTGKKRALQNPTFECGNRENLLHSGRIVPVYPQHGIITTRWMREKMPLAKGAISGLKETMPKNILKSDGLMPRSDAIMELHFPTSTENLKNARRRLSFEELFDLQLGALKRKQEWQAQRQERLKIPMNTGLIRAFFASLNFTPTDSQKVAIYEILKDLEKPVPMSRLLEGDVGSGKTLVATAVIANVVYYGGQCAFMVPTEVLAKQHAENVARLLKKTKVALLTGSTPAASAREIKLGLARGTVDVVIGTHSLIQRDIKFSDLKLAVVDEQHRFGVNQRNALKANGSPHFLSMTATPIPRTLALTAYGDHDLSVLLEKPGNRKPIHTKVVSPRGRRTVELFIDREISNGRQVYVICPLINENDDLAEVRNVTSEADRLRGIFPNREIGMLHGKLTPKEKNAIMAAFKDGKSDILVSTSVIEVGIDVPNATIIMIEGAERFGLAQLHQLRGRVGRSDDKSYCFLCTTDITQAKSQRLKAMEKFTDGFYLAEVDLKLRGPGEIYGTRQSGMPEIRAGSLADPELVIAARKAAQKMLNQTDPVVSETCRQGAWSLKPET